jgi:murein DD-endopeptidase MepM/ murein hydrolase activator NlpD
MFSGAGERKFKLFGREADLSGVRRVLTRIFRERELLIRTDGEVRFLRISARVQMAAAAAAVGGSIWALTAIPLAITQGVMISTDRSQIFEAQLAYADLLDEVTGYQNTVDSVTDALRKSRKSLEAQIAQAGEMERQLAGAGDAMAGPRASVAKSREVLQGHLERVNASLASIANDGEVLENSLAKIRSDLAGSEDGRKLVERARARLKERAEGLETRLAAVVAKNVKVEEENATLTNRIQVTTAERDGLVKQKEKLRSNIAALESRVAAVEDERQSLEKRRNELMETLASARAENEEISKDRLALQEQLAGLDSELMLTRSRQDEVKDDLQSVARSLQEVTGDSMELSDSPHALRSQIDGLLAELTNQQAIEDAVVQRATDRAAGSVEKVEKIVAMTGLNVDKLLSRIDSEGMGQGGPFIAASAGAPATDELDETMAQLDSSMTRWQSLREVLGAIPLSLPVDYYRLTSTFGVRTDPVNKRRAMHTGLDMAAAINTPVYAPAPGTVVYAGVKGRYGNVVEIDHGYGIITRFAHLNRILVEVGDVVGHRQRIALVGSTGRSTGPHLHYEVRFDGRPMDPMKFIKAGRYVFKN